MVETSPSGPWHRGLRALHLLLAGLALAAALAWLLLVFENRRDPEFWRRDWYCLWSVGQRFVAGEWRSVYRDACAPGYLWLYPPYMMYPWSLLARLPPLAAYATLTAATVAAVSAAMLLLRRALPPGRPFVTVVLATLASAAFNGTIVTGQHAAFLLLAASGSLWAAERRRQASTGLFAGLLGFKPNWVAFFLLWEAVTRRWKALLVTCVFGIVLLASTLPLGGEIWREYLDTVTGRIPVSSWSAAGAGQVPSWKGITAEAFVRSLLGSAPVTDVVARIVQVGILVAVVWTWLRRREPRRQVAVATLAAIAANPYAMFYDALPLALPAAVWWMAPEAYRRGVRTGIGVCVAAIWTTQWVTLYLVRSDSQPSLTGGLVLAWLLLEVFGGARPGACAAPTPHVPSAPVRSEGVRATRPGLRK